MIKNILFITPLPPPITGQSLACYELCKYLKNNKKYKVDVINLSKKSFVSGKISFGRIIEIAYIFIKLLCLRSKYDFIYFTPSQSKTGSYKDQLIYLFLLNRINKLYVHLHGGAGMEQLLSQKNTLIYKLNKFFLSRVAGIIVLGERLKSIYIGIVDEKKIHTVENFTQDNLFIKYSELKNKNKCSKLKVLFLSNLLPGKGYIELLYSAKFLPESEVEFHFAGGFENTDDKEHFLENISGRSNIFYHGIVNGNKKRELLIDSDIFCLPTYYPYEGQPISILEAYAAGCAVITTNHSGIFDIFEPGRNGCVVHKKDPKDLEDAIAYFINNPESMHKILIANIVDARRKFRLGHHLDKITTVLIHKQDDFVE